MRVLLLNMPFVSLARPSIGVSLLKARLAEEGIECSTGYANLYLAQRVGRRAYEVLTDEVSAALFAGDWLFAQHLFPSQLDHGSFVATLQQNVSPEAFESILALRAEIGPYLEACLERFRVAEYDVIGFTTTFEQNLGSLALSYLIRSCYPEKTIVFGGANCEGIMGLELHRQFPWIDFVCSGESDFSFPELIKRLDSRSPLDGIPGLIWRNGSGSMIAGPADRVHEMDQLPDPDYDDYFEALRWSPETQGIEPALLIESARGCWWGAKSHCTFCGLNGSSMAFRAKSAERVYGEIERQKTRYGIDRFLAVDNILSHEYFRTLLPMLKERKPGVSLFYEIKSNLKREQIELLRDAGVLAIQPGIESLSTHVLQLMRKGVTAIQNVQLLKWCREYGITLAWNLLYGFPGETAEDYIETAAVAEAVNHLKSPGAVSPIRLDRFSPNFDHADSFGLTKVRPFSTYSYLYPLPAESIANLAYFFEYEHTNGRDPQTYLGETLRHVNVWKQNRGGDLVKRYAQDPELTLVDTRPGRERLNFPLNGVYRQIYDYCDDIRSRASIASFVHAQQHDDGPWLDAFLNQMTGYRLMLREGHQYLSLAVKPDSAQPSDAAVMF
jgi:ribosomal peptide maturation radical SAM protein 1